MSTSRPFAWLASGALLGLAGCLDLSLVADVVFPATIGGLPPDQPYVAFPVGKWVNDADLEAKAMVACFAAECTPQAAIGLFSAAGPEGLRLKRIAEDSARLARLLASPQAPAKGAARKRQPVIASAERFRSGSAQGFLVKLARQDGSHAAYGGALLIDRAGRLDLLLVISPSEDGTRRLLQDVTAAQG